MADHVEEVSFKKLKTKKNFRKVDKSIDQSDDIKKDQLEEVKLLQKRRVRSKGVTSVVDVAGTAPGEAPEEQKIMGQSFQQQQATVNQQQSQMDKYIAAQLAARRAGGKKEEVKQPSQYETEEQQLYKTPDILKNAKPDEEIGEAGDRWLTGIAEVPLPIADKLKTIEETEKAKEKLFASKAAAGGPTLTIPANYNSNFSQHQKEFAEKRKEQFRASQPAQTVDARQTAPSRKRPAEGSAGGPTATDDRAVSQFLKSVRWH